MNEQKKPFGRFIIFIAILSTVCGTTIGIGIGTVKSVLDKYTSEENNGNNFSFNNLYTQDNNYAEVQYIPTMTSSEINNVVSPSIVYIESSILAEDFFNNTYETPSGGSGIIYKQSDDKYYIATNNHVIENASKIKVIFNGGEIIEANLTGGDTQTDLAVIEVLKSNISNETKNSLKVAEFADSDTIKVGEPAIAIGTPLGAGFENSMTQGIVSGINREVQVNDRNLTLIQTDAAINPGNSGGALVNSEAKVIGINSIKIVQTSVEGIGFAIPSNIAIPILDDLVANGIVARPQLGIKGSNITEQSSEVYVLPLGIYVVEVIPESSAQKAGIIASDIITEFNGEKIFDMDSLNELIKKCKVGDTVNVKIIRNSSTPMLLQVTLDMAKN